MTHEQNAGRREAEYKDEAELKVFLNGVINTFFEDPDLFDLRSALITNLEELDEEGKRELLKISERHFISDHCFHHDKEIVVPKHPEVTFELTRENLDGFLANEGYESVKMHIRQLVPDRWVKMLKSEADRLEKYVQEERYNSGTPG